VCGRVTETDATRIVRELAITGHVPELGATPRYNIPPSDFVPVVRVFPRELVRRLDLLKWGLVPSWAKDASIGNRLVNARVESVTDKAAYREPFERRRCLVVVDGFYEWKRQGRLKQPYLLRARSGELLAMAGLWERWTSRDGEIVETFVVITKPAEPGVVEIHDRMPAILRKEDFDTWLSPKQRDAATLLSLLGNTSPNLVATAVTPRVNKPDYDAPDCVEPLTVQPGLFD